MTNPPEITLRISEEEADAETNGRFAVCGTSLTVGAGQEGSKDLTIGFGCSILIASLELSQVEDGDEIRFEQDPDKNVGALAVATADQSDVIEIPAALMAAFVNKTMFPGLELKLKNGADQVDLGAILSFDEASNTLKTKNKTDKIYSAGSSILVTGAMTTSPFLEDDGWLPLAKSQSTMDVGLSKIGSSYKGAGCVLRIRYRNNSLIEVTVRPRFEILY